MTIPVVVVVYVFIVVDVVRQCYSFTLVRTRVKRFDCFVKQADIKVSLSICDADLVYQHIRKIEHGKTQRSIARQIKELNEEGLC